MTDAFLEEQKNKPELTKRMECTECQGLELQKKLPSARKVAEYIVRNAETNDFAICNSFESGLLWSNIIESSPKRGFGILGLVLRGVVGVDDLAGSAAQMRCA
jgi:3-dehydrosphinganine reductase